MPKIHTLSAITPLALACAAFAQPANSAAPMRDVNPGSTGQSAFRGPDNRGSFRWWTILPPAGTVPLANVVLGPNGTVYAPGTFALDRTTGSVLWTTNSPSATSSSPTIDALGRIYSQEPSTGLVARNSVTGAQLWTTPILNGSSNGHITKVSPNGQIVSINRSGSLYSFRPDGSLAWQSASTFEAAFSSNANPAFDSSSNIYLAHNGGLTSFSITGQIRWNVAATTTATASSSRAMVADDGSIVCAGGGRVAWHSSVTGAVLTEFAAPGERLVAIDSLRNSYFLGVNESIVKRSASGVLLWSYNQWNRGLVVDAVGNVFTSNTNGDILALSSTGSLLWRLRAGRIFSGDIAPVIGANGELYMYSDLYSEKFVISIIPAPISAALFALSAGLVARRRRA